MVRDLIKVISEWSSSFPYFLQFKSEFGNKEFMIWDIVSSRSYFCWWYSTSPSLAAKNIINLILVLTIWWCPCVESSLVLLEEAKDIKKRWQEYTKELYKKDLHDPGSHNGVITHPEPDILEWEVKWALWSITKLAEVMEFQLSHFKS